MNKQETTPSPQGLDLSDIYHILFRHKWKILVVWAVGLGAAAALWFKWPVPWQSEAKLLIKYVLDSNPPSPVGSNPQVQTPDSSGQSVMNTEVEILSSFDLALQVADAIGPARILASQGGGTDRLNAAATIASGLKVDEASRSAVIHIVFQSRDRDIVQPVLKQLIDSYLAMHREIHQDAGSLNEFLIGETAQFRQQLSATEDELRKLKNEVGVISLDDTKKAYTERLARIQEALDTAEAELAEREATLDQATNESVAGMATNRATTATFIPSNKANEYAMLRGLLDALGKKELAYRSIYKPDSPMVQELREQIASNQAAKDHLEKDYPQLALSPVAVSPADAGSGSFVSSAVADAKRARELQAKITTLNGQLEGVRKGITAIDGVEGKITDLEIKRKLEEQNLQLFQASLEKTRIDDSLGVARISNISPIQSPSPPFKDLKKFHKKLLGPVAVTLGGGIALAFLLELYLDRSIKRPKEVEAKLGLPLFLSIPWVGLNGKSRHGAAKTHRHLLPNAITQKANSEDAVPFATPAPLTPHLPHQSMRPFFEALRDRLLLFFEAKNLTHKPKLVAVTHCTEGAGVSTIASGLAASLSETGDGNVLLVDMTVAHGVAHYFHKGELSCGLDEALASEKRDQAMVQDNLYVVSGTSSDGNLPRVLHKRFLSLVPKLKASDYDYIIFDMPPVSQISPTSRLSQFMDMVFMVVESEKTDRDMVKRATAMLSENQPNIGIILNKTHRYVPRLLQQEI